jgi:signal peptidase II
LTRGLWILLVVAASGFALDLWSKDAAFALVPSPRDRVVVVEDFFVLDHVRNPGMAWSLFQGVDRWIWIVLRSGLVVALLWLYRTTTRPEGAPWWAHVGFGCLLGGALGNLYDNVFAEDGHVRDFLHFIFGGRHFPVFNVADSLITVGAPLLFLHVLRHERRVAREAAAAKAEGAAAASRESAGSAP